MISRSLLVVGNLCRTHNVASRVMQSRSQIRTLFASQPLQKPLSEDDKNLWIEDNLLLNIKEAENETIVEAVPTKTGREDKLIPTPTGNSTACALCRLNLTNLNYTDVMILTQFIKKNGSIVTYHESKLCTKQYKKVTRLITQAQRCNLIQRPADYLVPGPWHDLNTYLELDRKRDQPMKVIKKEYWKI